MSKAVDIFISRLTQDIKETGSNLILTATSNALESLYSNSVRFSPVDTGSFRSGFYISISNPIMDSRRETPSIPPTEGSYPNSTERAISGIDSVKSRINPTIGQKFYITNATVSGANGIPSRDAYGYYINIEYTGWGSRPPYMPIRRSRALTAATVKGVIMV